MKVEVKLQSLGETRETPKPMEATSEKSKKVVEFPDVRLSSANIEGLDNLTMGQKCSLVFDAEVTGIRKADKWETDPKKIYADFSLKKGAIESKEAKEYKDVDDVAAEAKKKLEE